MQISSQSEIVLYLRTSNSLMELNLEDMEDGEQFHSVILTVLLLQLQMSELEHCHDGKELISFFTKCSLFVLISLLKQTSKDP